MKHLKKIIAIALVAISLFAVTLPAGAAALTDAKQTHPIQAINLIIGDENESVIAPMAWLPLVGDWIGKAVQWLMNNSATLNHIFNKLQHNLTQAGIHTAQQLGVMVRHVLSTGTAVNISGNVWYIYGTWNGWSVTIHGAIVDGLYRISTLFLN